MKKKPAPSDELTYITKSLAIWMLARHTRLHDLKKVPRDQKVAIQKRAAEIIQVASRNKSLRTLREGECPIALAMIHPSKDPRVPNQQSLFFIYDDAFRKKASLWLDKTLRELAKRSPKHSQIALLPADEKIVTRALEDGGFNTRYEILMGETHTALKNLRRDKSPPRDLTHLGLELKPITKIGELKDVMRLQKRVSLKSKRHVYFSHKNDQLKKDEAEYRQIITGRMDGSLLGVYRKTKILGLMVTSIHTDASPSEKNGGFSFFLDPSIQGLGITKTGYLLLLEYLKEKGIRKFYGGTSQPAIQNLGKLMKREVQRVIYVKM